MGLKDCQKEVDDWLSQFKDPYWHPLSQLARATEELGELARELNNRYGGKVKKSSEKTKDIGIEICDIIFSLCCIANKQKIDLDNSWKEMMDKYKKRDKDRYEKKI